MPAVILAALVLVGFAVVFLYWLFNLRGKI